MNEFDKLIELFRKFPGVGTRQAQRFAHFVVRQNQGYVQSLVKNLESAKATARFCARCQRLAFAVDDRSLCNLCSSNTRDTATLMIVEKDADLDAIEKSRVYNGEYFVLGGTLPMRSEEAEKYIRINALNKTLDYYLQGELAEVIIGLSLTPEGEYTGDHLLRAIESSSGDRDLKITFLGRGLSVGSELEYSDKDTLRYALGSRR